MYWFRNSLLLEQVRTLGFKKSLHLLYRSLRLALKFVSTKLGHLDVVQWVAAKSRLIVLMCGVEVRDFKADGRGCHVVNYLIRQVVSLTLLLRVETAYIPVDILFGDIALELGCLVKLVALTFTD